MKTAAYCFVWVKDDRRRSGNGLAPIQVFNAVLSPPFSAPRNSHSRFRHQTDVLKNGAPKLPFFSSGRFPHLDQAQTSAAPGLAGYPQGRFEKAKPSTVAAAIPGPSPSFLATQNGREPVTMYGRHLGRPPPRSGGGARRLFRSLNLLTRETFSEAEDSIRLISCNPKRRRIRQGHRPSSWNFSDCRSRRHRRQP